MGCQVSTQHKTLPSSPSLKSQLPKKTSLRLVYPGSTSESPNNNKSSPSRGRRSDAEFSILRSESRKSIGTMDNIKPDVSLKDKNMSPLIRIIGIGTPRDGPPSEDSVKRSNESSDVSPYNRSPKRDFTFHSGDNSMVLMSGDSLISGSHKQFSRYLSITPKPSEFFIQKLAGQSGNIVKLRTFGASSSIPADIKSEEEVDSLKKSHVRSMGEIQLDQNSLQTVDQEIFIPETPGFRSMATNVSTQNNFDTTATAERNLEMSQRKDTFREKKGQLDLEKVVKKLENEKVKQDKESAREFAFRGRIPHLQSHHQHTAITEKDETGSKYSKSSERNNSANRTTQTIHLPPQAPEQEQFDDNDEVSQNSQRRSNSVYSLISSQLTGKNKYKLFMEEKMKKMQVSQVEETNKDGMKKVFTTNLLDLLSHRKDTPSPTTLPNTQAQTPIVARRQLRNYSQKSHNASSDESNMLTLSLVYGKSTPAEHKKANKNVEPLRFGALEHFRGGAGELVSPIGHVKSGSVTPYSQGNNASEIHDEKTITNMDNLSRMDFDKYSFVAEVREVEVNQYTSYEESLGALRSSTKKFTGLTGLTGNTQWMRTLETQQMKTLESEETYRKIAAYLDDRNMPRFDTEEV